MSAPINLTLDISAPVGGLAVRLTSRSAPATNHATALTLPALIGTSALQQQLSLPGLEPAPVASMQIDCDRNTPLNNSGRTLGHLWTATPPLGCAAHLQDSTGRALFSGIIQTIETDSHIRLHIESGQQRPLSATLALRTSAAWGHWRDIRPLPWGYGRVVLEPLQYSHDRRIFVLLDHPIEAVEHLWRDNHPSQAFAWHNGVDSTGHPASFLELADPLSEGETLRVQLRGKRHPHTGHLLQTPGDILGDILTHLAGLPEAAGQLHTFSHHTRHIELGGTLADNTITARAVIDHLLQSIGAAWSPDLPEIATLWPPPATQPHPALEITPLHTSELQAASSHQHIYTRLRILFDWDDSLQRHRQSLEATAPQAIKEHGDHPLEWPAPWLRHARDARQLAQRILGQTARPRWRISWQQNLTTARIGDTAALHHPHSPLQGHWPIVATDIDSTSATLQCSVIGNTGPAPDITLGTASRAFEPLLQPGITVETAAGEILFTATGENGQPLAGASITLDGGATRIADNRGRVSFPAARGKHTLLVRAQGYPDSTTEIIV